MTEQKIEFYGEGDRIIDAAGRLAIPSSYKNLTETWRVIALPDKPIVVIAPNKKTEQGVIETFSTKTTLDSQGRILIPKTLRKNLGITTRKRIEVKILGRGDHYHIITLENWEKGWKKNYTEELTAELNRKGWGVPSPK